MRDALLEHLVVVLVLVDGAMVARGSARRWGRRRCAATRGDRRRGGGVAGLGETWPGRRRCAKAAARADEIGIDREYMSSARRTRVGDKGKRRFVAGGVAATLGSGFRQWLFGVLEVIRRRHRQREA